MNNLPTKAELREQVETLKNALQLAKEKSGFDELLAEIERLKKELEYEKNRTADMMIRIMKGLKEDK